MIYEAMQARGVPAPTVDRMEIFQIAVALGAHQQREDEGISEEQWQRERDMSSRVEAAQTARASREELIRRSKGL